MQQFVNFIKAYAGTTFTVIASLCSIIGLVLMFMSNKEAVMVALCVIIIGFISLIIGILRGINKLVKDNSSEDYKPISSFYTFKSYDGVRSEFEVFRTIQCKRLFLTEIPYNFKWTGSKAPEITSIAQDIDPLNHVDDKDVWDTTKIRFREPLKYNECTVIHIKTENDDCDNTAKPWISSRLNAPINFMVFRVMLAYKPDEYMLPAIFERKKIDTQIDGDYVRIDSVTFDKQHKCYYYTVVNPEPGYIYRLRWEK